MNHKEAVRLTLEIEKTALMVRSRLMPGAGTGASILGVAGMLSDLDRLTALTEEIRVMVRNEVDPSNVCERAGCMRPKAYPGARFCGAACSVQHEAKT